MVDQQGGVTLMGLEVGGGGVGCEEGNVASSCFGGGHGSGGQGKPVVLGSRVWGWGFRGLGSGVRGLGV